MSEKKTTKFNKDMLFAVIGTILCMIFICILSVNCTLLIKGYTNSEKVATFCGYYPLIVLTDSMYPEIKTGDLIICRTIDADDVQVGDTISFFDPEGNDQSVVTHQVIKILEDGSFETKGINNNVADALPVPSESLIGIYRIRIAGAGNAILFLQSMPGLVFCVIPPIVMTIAYYLLRYRKYEKKKQAEADALLTELEVLRTKQAETECAKEQSQEDTTSL